MSVHVLNPMQMQLFVDPEEHIESLRGSIDLNEGYTADELWKGKEEEARSPEGSGRHGAGLYDSVKKYGLVTGRDNPFSGPPIELHPASDESGWVQGEGHHRVAAAAAVQRDTGKKQWFTPTYRRR
jgi:hypothetical protein